MNGEDFNIPPPPNASGGTERIPPPPQGNRPPPHVAFNYKLLQAFAETTQAAVRNGIGAIISEPIKMDGEDHEPICFVEMIYDLNVGLETMNENLERMNELLILQLQAAGVIEDDDEEEERPRRKRKKARTPRR